MMASKMSKVAAGEHGRVVKMKVVIDTRQKLVLMKKKSSVCRDGGLRRRSRGRKFASVWKGIVSGSGLWLLVRGFGFWFLVGRMLLDFVVDEDVVGRRKF